MNNQHAVNYFVPKYFSFDIFRQFKTRETEILNESSQNQIADKFTRCQCT